MMNEQYPIDSRWSAKVSRSGFSAVPTSFLRHYAQLGISSTEAMLLIHIMAHKWNDRLPFPAVKKLADEMGRSVSQVRARLSSLEKRGFIRRVARKGRSNLYDPAALISRLEKAIDDYNQKVAAEREAGVYDDYNLKAEASKEENNGDTTVVEALL